MDQRLRQEQTQKLALSPQIRQYLKLLQLPLLELHQAIEAELAENPMLEETASATAAEENLEATENQPLPDGKNPEEVKCDESFNHIELLSDDFQESYQYPDASGANVEDLKKHKNFQESLITKPEGLGDFLEWQIGFLELSEKQKKIADEITGNIDEEGYLRATLDEISAATASSPEEVLKVLEQIQELDPPGIGARNLQEALLLQLKRKGPEAEIAMRIVSNHLPLFEKRNWQELAKILSVDQETVKKATQLITHLDPKPGRTFYLEEPIAVRPDGAISFNEDEESPRYKIEIHDESIPELRINAYYRKMLRQKGLDEKTRNFLREKFQNAVNFIKAIGQRQSTLRAITEAIVKAQPDFFEKGFSYLKPLRLKDIAEIIGIHESTVSRAIHGKYITTPQGTIPYKSFFSTKLETTSGESESQKSIMEKIRSLITGESAEHPYSDEKIVEILRSEGLVIARRTVAKYRNLLKILPSHLRRKR
ncbi:MAG: RNA polymerase factor sigma-54 [Candidatus Omnitrophica bacterium]|nr:RNA polymerase factor sigma-54 [Candidatus Omnitrophota bacterium]